MSRRTLAVGLGIGVAGLALYVVLALADPGRAARAYLVAYLFWLSLALGLLCLLLISLVTRARWIVVLRRLVELSTATLWVFVPLFVPLFLWRGELYPWASAVPHGGHAEEALAHRAAFMSPLAWLGRAAFYLGVWAVLGERLLRLALESDGAPSPRALAKSRQVAAIGLPALALTLTFASFDWVMSLDPFWASTMFGVYVFAGAFAAALALLVFMVRAAEQQGALRGLVRPSHYGAVGRLLFAFVIFWAYIAYAQFFIVWMGDLPEEVPWYAARLSRGWLEVSVGLCILHFAVPFFVLMPPANKRRALFVGTMAGSVLLAHLVDVYWLVMPSFGPLSPGLVDLAALIMVGVAVGLGGAWRARRWALVPKHDPDLQASLGYQGS